MSVHTEEKTKDGRKWYFTCYYNDNFGNRKQYKSKRYMTRREAEQEELLFKTKKNNPSYIKFDTVSLDYFKELKIRRKESTYMNYLFCYRKHIEPYFTNKYINDINVLMLNEWRQDILNKGISNNYCNFLYGTLKAIFDYAIRNFDYNDNPVTRIGRFESSNKKVITDDEKIRYITLDDFNKFISVIDDITWKTFFIFLFYTGMRKGEVQALSWNDIDFNNNQIIVNKTINTRSKLLDKNTSTKNNLNRKIKMSKTLINSLLEYKEYMMKYTDFKNTWYVFGGSIYLASTTIDRYKHKYFELSEVKEITCHEFRHSHVSLLINEYVKSGQTDTTKFFLMMSDRMGHTIDVMKSTYLHLFPTIQNEIVDLLDNL